MSDPSRKYDLVDLVSGLAASLIIGGILGGLIGNNIGIALTQQKAVRDGCAEYVADEQGVAQFECACQVEKDGN